MVWRWGSGWFWGRLWACLACSPFSASVNPLPAPGHNGREEAWPRLGRNKGNQREQQGAGDPRRSTGELEPTRSH